MSKIAVLGNGGFGTAMAIAAHRAGHEVIIWAHDAEYAAECVRTRRNPRYLPEVDLPASIDITADGARALEAADLLLVAVPTQHLRTVLLALRSHVPLGVPLVSLAKGLEFSTAMRPSEVIRAVVANSPILALSGPSHAEEVARGLPAAVVLAGAGPQERRSIQAALSDRHLRIYRSEDLLGVELCGALKNVMAVAAGVAEGLGLGDNTKAAILSRGLAEMTRFGLAAGAQAETFHGLAGVGDLAVTAFSPHGRNRAFGVRIGHGESLADILASTKKVAEGVHTSRVVQQRARELGVEMPLCDAVCAVLFEGKSPLETVRALMERDRKRESE